MIEIYASRLSDAGKEQYRIRKRQLLTDWLYRHGIERSTPLDRLAISVYVGGKRLLPAQWPKVNIGPASKVEIYREPKGTDPFSITFALVFGAKAVLAALMPKIPGMNNNTGARGEALDQASSKGNKVKINDVIPELFGYNPQRYPDVLVPPRSYYAGPREPRTEFCLGVGRGKFQIDLDEVRTGETPLLTMGPDALFTIYGPGADLSADEAHFFWYQAPEVGSGSTGAAGLELTVESDLTGQATASVFTFNGDVVGIPTGAGQFPADWVAGTIINPAAPYVFSVSDGGGTDGRDIITGPMAQHNFVAGDSIQIVGDNQGFYVVFAVTPTAMEVDYEGGSPGTGLQTGSCTMAMSYRGMRWRVENWSAQALQVTRITSGGADDPSWPGWDSTSSNQAQVLLDSSNLAGGYRGPFPACPANQVVVKIEVDIFYPSGIVFLDAKGNYGNLTGYQSLEYRDMAIGGAWTATTVQATSNNLDAQGYSYAVDLPYPMRAEVRMKKIFVNQGSGDPDKEQNDTMLWQRLKGLVSTSSPTSYAGLTVMTADIRGGDRISSQSESLINLGCTRILPVLRAGVWSTEEPTRELSAAFGHVVRSVGYSDTQDIDLAELHRLESTRWTPRGDTYDRVVNKQSTVKQHLIDILDVGFSVLTIDRGLLVPVRDELRGESFDHVYNPQVMLEPLSYDFKMPDQPDDFNGVDVEYYDHLTRQNETRQCRLAGDAGTRVQKLKLEGVGDEVRAWRWGMRRRRAHIYRQREFQFKTELDALNSAYFDYVALGAAIPGYGQSSKMNAYASRVVTSSERLDWSKPGTYKAVIRRRDGTASGPYVVSRVDDYRFRLPVDLDFVPNLTGAIEYPVIQFGHGTEWCFPALITDVNPQGTRTCTVKAMNYDPRMFNDDDGFPPD